MTEQVQYTVEFTIKPGKQDAFKGLAKSIISMVRDNEPNMKGYQWYFNEDESKCYVAEWHTSSSSLMEHLGNVQEALPELLQHSDISRLEVLGNPSPEAREALSGLGAKVHGYFDGFTRN